MSKQTNTTSCRSPWINLDAWKSLEISSHERKKTPRTNRPNIFNQKIPIIEDDNSQQKFSNRKSSAPKRLGPSKRRRMESLHVTISNEGESSNESVKYDPDATESSLSEVKTTIKPILTLSTSTSTTEPSSVNCPKNPSTSHSNHWSILKKSFAENTDLSESIVDCSDSDEFESNTSPAIASTLLDSLIEDSSTDSSPIPSLTTVQELIIETEESVTPPVDLNFQMRNEPKKRKTRFVKGGMAERLNKCLSKAKSNLLFWQHHRSANLIPSGTHVRVERVEQTFGRTILHTHINDTPTMLCLHPNTPQCKTDDVIEVEFDRRRKHKLDDRILYLFVDKISHIK